MSIKAGLVGLPNVGKSTLFNALTNSQIPAENYPFCTIDPHQAITQVPDNRLEILKKIYNSQKIIPATVTFVDIAGLVKGAAAGEGLGNQFLSHIREVDLIIHVLRCFEDPNIIHTSQTVDPLTDYEIIVQELMLKDLESVEKRLQKIESTLKKLSGPEKKEAEQELALLVNVQKALNQANNKEVKELIQNATITTLPLLSAKNILVVANIAESELENNAYQQNKHFQSLINHFGTETVIPVSAKIEYELTQLPSEEAQEIMNMMGLKERGLDAIIQKSYQKLNLISFFTCGPQEIHTWTIKKGTLIRKAAGEIHSDLEKGFICAEVTNAADLIALGSEVKVKETGKMRTEGQNYIMHDGDIINVRFNV